MKSMKSNWGNLQFHSTLFLCGWCHSSSALVLYGTSSVQTWALHYFVFTKRHLLPVKEAADIEVPLLWLSLTGLCSAGCLALLRMDAVSSGSAVKSVQLWDKTWHDSSSSPDQTRAWWEAGQKSRRITWLWSACVLVSRRSRVHAEVFVVADSMKLFWLSDMYRGSVSPDMCQTVQLQGSKVRSKFKLGGLCSCWQPAAGQES